MNFENNNFTRKILCYKGPAAGRRWGEFSINLTGYLICYYALRFTCKYTIKSLLLMVCILFLNENKFQITPTFYTQCAEDKAKVKV